jgi:hypothetical protein
VIRLALKNCFSSSPVFAVMRDEWPGLGAVDLQASVNESEPSVAEDECTKNACPDWIMEDSTVVG